MTVGKTKVAVLDDEANMRSALARLLKTHGYDVELFETGGDFINAVRSRDLDCLLLDLHMPQITGFDVLELMAALRITTPVIVITGHDETGVAERVRKLGAANYLLKPLDEAVLIDALQRICPPLPASPDGHP
jgi:FixJ family two-component response regulator